MNFLVETSARHVHITQSDLEKIFGEGATLTLKKELSQPGEFACEERVTVVGPKGQIAGVSILGPTRAATQVEISLTDARSLGIAAPVKASGDLEGAAPLKIVGPKGEIDLPACAIAAKRHIHCTPDDAAKLGVADKEIVGVKVTTKDRSLIFGDVVVRVSPKFATAMHIDTDEANAAGASGQVYGEVVKF